MPWYAAKTDKCPKSKPWGVFKKSDGELVGCSVSKQKAQDHLKALYANEKK